VRRLEAELFDETNIHDFGLLGRWFPRAGASRARRFYRSPSRVG
jgi:hypothetical protein